MISVEVGTRAGFWIPGVVQVVSVTAMVDGVPVTQPDNAELGGGNGSGSINMEISAPVASLAIGEHVLTGRYTVRFIERRSGCVDDYSVSGLCGGISPERIIGVECELTLPQFRFTVAEGIEIPIPITDATLAVATRNQIEFGTLRWAPAKSFFGIVQFGFNAWDLRVRFGRPFAPIACELQLHDAEGRLLAEEPLVVDTEGRIAPLSWTLLGRSDGASTMSWFGGAREPLASGWSQVILQPAPGLPRDADGIPKVAEPVTVSLKPSREAALRVPEVDAYLAFEMTARIPVHLRPGDQQKPADVE